MTDGVMEQVTEKVARNIHYEERLLYGFHASSGVVPGAQYEWGELPNALMVGYINQAKAILSIPEILIKDPDQKPKVVSDSGGCSLLWAEVQAKNMLKEDWVKVLPKEEK